MTENHIEYAMNNTNQVNYFRCHNNKLKFLFTIFDVNGRHGN